MNSLSREQEQFPTRNYLGPVAVAKSGPAFGVLAQGPAASATLYRMVLGLDAVPRPMTADELQGLADPVGRLLQSGRPFPLTLRDLLSAFDALNGTPEELPNQLVFLVADGGDIPWSAATDQLNRAFRFAIARGRGDFPVLISASTRPDSAADAAFLQVLGWDAENEVFHYYQRRGDTYFWAGNSEHALAAPTRGQGPFDSHVNGSLVMKELRAPWLHWHAPLATIEDNVLAPNDPLAHDSLFAGRVSAERLEQEIVRPGIQQWNAARVRKALDKSGTWHHVPRFLRQIITDTTVNLASSEQASSLLADDEQLHLPRGFFLNSDTLFNALDLVPVNAAVASFAIPARLYLDCLRHYDVHRQDNRLRVEGDVHFAFLTPEPAFEDTNLTVELLQAGVLTPRFVACLSMTDFTNPVFSARRAALLRYVPETASVATFEAAFVAAVEAAVAASTAGAPGPGPEQEFLANWHTADWQEAFRQRISTYCAAVQAGAADPVVVDGWFRLLESRRRRFRRRPLAEFSLTTPRTNIPEDAPHLRMSTLGRAEELA